jgi:hypothetical protein
VGQPPPHPFAPGQHHSPDTHRAGVLPFVVAGPALGVHSSLAIPQTAPGSRGVGSPASYERAKFRRVVSGFCLRGSRKPPGLLVSGRIHRKEPPFAGGPLASKPGGSLRADPGSSCKLPTRGYSHEGGGRASACVSPGHCAAGAVRILCANNEGFSPGCGSSLTKASAPPGLQPSGASCSRVLGGVRYGGRTELHDAEPA